jgi:hypothetical protein
MAHYSLTPRVKVLADRLRSQASTLCTEHAAILSALDSDIAGIPLLRLRNWNTDGRCAALSSWKIAPCGLRVWLPTISSSALMVLAGKHPVHRARRDPQRAG